MHQHRTALAVTLFVAALGVRLQTASPVGAAAQTASGSAVAASDPEAATPALGHRGSAPEGPRSSSTGDDPGADSGGAPVSGGPATSAAGSVEPTESLSTRTTASATPTPAPVAAPTTPVPPPTATAHVATPPTTSVSASAAEAQVLALVNAERAGAGLAPLRLNSSPMAVARGWSSSMAAHTLDHNPNLVGDLAQAGTGDWRSAAENVGQGQSVDQVHGMFMASPVHRANILGVSFSQVGIGVATTGDQVFVTLDFLGW